MVGCIRNMQGAQGLKVAPFILSGMCLAPNYYHIVKAPWFTLMLLMLPSTVTLCICIYVTL